MYNDPLNQENRFEKYPGGAPGTNETVTDAAEAGEEYNKGISDAAALINYGLDAAAREKWENPEIERQDAA